MGSCSISKQVNRYLKSKNTVMTIYKIKFEPENIITIYRIKFEPEKNNYHKRYLSRIQQVPAAKLTPTCCKINTYLSQNQQVLAANSTGICCKFNRYLLQIQQIPAAK